MVRKELAQKLVILTSILLFTAMFTFQTGVFAKEGKQRIYDEADLLTPEEEQSLEKLADEYGAKRKTDFIVITSKDADEKDIKKFIEDFYDEKAPGYDIPHGNAAILAMDMDDQDFYIAGFYKAEKYLDNERLDLINAKITPDLKAGNYYEAFETYITTSYEYMRVWPGINPESFILDWWFHILLALGIGAVVVGGMAYNSGGKITVNERTYTGDFKVLERRDVYLRKNVTRRLKPKNNNNSSGGGGGGITSGGHSHSGSRGSF